MKMTSNSSIVALVCFLLLLASQSFIPLAEAIPAIAGSAGKAPESSARSLGLNEVTRIYRTPGVVNPFERVILDQMEKLGYLDPTKGHIKRLISEQDSFDFDAHLSAASILHRSKFEHEVFNVTSQDGYITQLVRIINPLVPKTLLKWPPVALYAGQGVSSAAFLMASMPSHVPVHWPVNTEWPGQSNGANRSLAITLANNGYDVWLIGARGSDPENRGKTSPKSALNATGIKAALPIKGQLLDEKLKRFLSTLAGFPNHGYWSFSHDDIIRYEFKTQLDLILSTAQQESLSLITYSNGGFIAYAFASLEPQYASKHIDTLISLAPAVYTNKFNLVLGATGLLSSLAPPNSAILDENLDKFAKGLWHKVCKSKVLRYTKCKTAMDLLYGFSDNFQTHFELNILDYVGRPMSSSGFRQTLQCSYASQLQYYDFGVIGNLVKYNQLLPPAYNLKVVRQARSYVVSGGRDGIVDQTSIRKLMDDCGSKPLKNLKVSGYNHLDLLAGWDVDVRVNTPILELLDKRYLELTDQVEHDHHLQTHGQPERPVNLPTITQGPKFRDSAKDKTTTVADRPGVSEGAPSKNNNNHHQAMGSVQSQPDIGTGAIQDNSRQKQQQQQLSLGQNGGIQLQDSVQPQSGNRNSAFQQQQRLPLQDPRVAAEDGYAQDEGLNDGGHLEAPLESDDSGEQNSDDDESGTLGWSDAELGLTQARGMQAAPKTLSRNGRPAKAR